LLNGHVTGETGQVIIFTGPNGKLNKGGNLIGK